MMDFVNPSEGKPVRELLIATHNRKKLAEMQSLLGDVPFSLLTVDDVGFEPDFRVDEVGETFEGNALIKAFICGKKSGKLSLGEDSGLEIDALGGRPGVFTKRYAEGTPDNGHAKIFAELNDVPEEKRGAQFRSVVAIYDPATDKVRICEGVARGTITHAARGSAGFGQDPIFEYEGTGKTGGEMTTEEKNAVSHRGKSFAKVREILLKEFV
jgi:non-canonical purine NTP pyrophosphatase (RdgB/HAM1 family)